MEEMKSMFKWVHLSDLHFRSLVDSGFNSTELKEKLPPYLESRIQNADALIITGDYRYAPDKEENPQNVGDFIKKIASALKLEPEKIFLVAGNHDLDRSEVRSDVIRGVRSTYSTSQGTFSAERLKRLQEDFSFFYKLRKVVYGEDNTTVSTDPHCSISLEHCNLLLLNTALTAGMEDNGRVDDERQLLLGSSHLAAVVHDIKNEKPTIAVGHHGLKFLEAHEYDTCVTFLNEAGVRLYLCGHEHKLWDSVFGNQGKEITVGCLMQNTRSVEAGFSVGELMSNGTVSIQAHKWDMGKQNWYPHPPGDQQYEKLYHVMAEKQLESEGISAAEAEKEVVQTEHPFSLKGYILLGGRGIDGIKYIWERNGRHVESLAFNRRLKDSQDLSVHRISAYTCSVSYGCRLSCNQHQCRFCETGMVPYVGDVCAEDIALQNIFMAEYDSDCPSFPLVRGNEREFAFMGQGEPGLCYPAVRRAIQLTDFAMERIRQQVHRYIISTCGICDFIPILINDIDKGLFKNKITLHFSLHAVGAERTTLMPVNEEHNYKKFIKECEKFYSATGEKIGVGVLLFNKYRFSGDLESGKTYTLTPKRLETILQELDKDIFRIDLCDVNRTSWGSQSALSNENATRLLELVKRKGFEAKLFSSFGDSEQSGCGMLSSSMDNITLPGNKTKSQFNKSLELLNEAISAVDG